MYTFTVMPPLAVLQSSLFKDNMKKWDMERFVQLIRFKFESTNNENSFQPYHLDTLVQALFSSNELQSALTVFDHKGRPSKYQAPASPITPQQNLTKLNTMVTNMDFFDRLFTHKVVNKQTKTLCKCFDIYLEEYGLTISDKLKKMLLCNVNPLPFELEEALADDMARGETYMQAYLPEETNEFIYHILKRLVFGGSMNQYDDTIETYLECTKLLYKELVTYVCM